MWWVLTDQETVPFATALQVNATTNVADHLFMAWEYYKPARHPIYKTVRGLLVLCGYKWVWDTPQIAEQELDGDTIDHTFNLPDLKPASTIWFYLFAPDGPYGLEIQGPLTSVTLPAAGPPPQPISPPITWNIPDRILRCGNRYTFWTNNTWYAMIPTTTAVTMWRLFDSTFVRMDQTHEPGPITGTITDADARLDSVLPLIHVAFYNKSTSPNDHLCRYVIYNVATDTWGAPETAHSEPYHPWSAQHTSIALDRNNVPHVVFPKIDLGFPIIYYANRRGATWSAAEMAIWSHYRVITCPSVWIDPFYDAFTVAAVTNLYLRWLNRRLAGGNFYATMQSLDSAVNLPHHSLMAGVDVPHIAQIAQDWTVEHWEGIPPRTHQDSLSLPESHFANMISTPKDPGEICIIFADADDQLAYLYRPPADDWQPEVQLPYPVTNDLTANYNHPNIISCLWQEAGFQDTTFYAFYAPWV